MLAAIQAESGSQNFWAMKPSLIAEDIGLTKVRRRMDELMRAETAPIDADGFDR
jgi:hypothetical protein